jgi:hypothetical protein
MPNAPEWFVFGKDAFESACRIDVAGEDAYMVQFGMGIGSGNVADSRDGSSESWF